MDQDSTKRKFYKVPKDFLKGKKLVPHNFDTPEKPIHGELVHSELRFDLFYNSYDNIVFTEMMFLKENDYLKIDKIEEVDCEFEGMLEKLYHKKKISDKVKDP